MQYEEISYIIYYVIQWYILFDDPMLLSILFLLMCLQIDLVLINNFYPRPIIILHNPWINLWSNTSNASIFWTRNWDFSMARIVCSQRKFLKLVITKKLFTVWRLKLHFNFHLGKFQILNVFFIFWYKVIKIGFKTPKEVFFCLKEILKVFENVWKCL